MILFNFKNLSWNKIASNTWVSKVGNIRYFISRDIENNKFELTSKNPTQNILVSNVNTLEECKRRCEEHFREIVPIVIYNEMKKIQAIYYDNYEEIEDASI